jgi:hypothetical protein
MKTCSEVFLLLMAVFGSACRHSAQAYENGQPAPDTSWQQPFGQQMATLVLTDKPNELFADWLKPGLSVHISETDTASPGDLVAGVVFFSGCKTRAGLCDLEVTFESIFPDGSFDMKLEGELWSGKPPPAPGYMELGVATIAVPIEASSQRGLYTVRARVRDIVAGEEALLVRTFQVPE